MNSKKPVPSTPPSNKTRQNDPVEDLNRVNYLANEAGEDEIVPEMLEEIFARRAAMLARPLQEEEKDERVELALFRIGKELYGLDVQSIQDIHPCTSITPLPRVPRWIKGVTNLGGDILAVLDLQSFLNLSPAEAQAGGASAGAAPGNSYLIRIFAPEMEMALQVDEVLAIEMLSTGKILEKSDVTRGLPAEYVRGIYLRETVEKSPVLILNLAKLLADPRLIIQEEII